METLKYHIKKGIFIIPYLSKNFKDLWYNSIRLLKKEASLGQFQKDYVVTIIN